MGAPRGRKQAPEAEKLAVVKVEVPVLVDKSGHARALPACRSLTVVGLAPGSLVESPGLDSASADVASRIAREAALKLGPGRHDVSLEVTVGPTPAAHPDDAPVGTPLDGWVLAEELLAVDLTQLGETEPPAASGHAIEARLSAADAPDGAQLLYLRPPQGPGVRVLECAEVGAAVGSDVVLRVVAHGHDRATALARLHRALSSCAVVVANCTTNRPALLAAVAAELAGSPGQPPASDPVAVLVAAVRTSDSQRDTQRAAFHARAARGRPEPVDAAGVSTSLDYNGQQYALQVFQTGPRTYRVDAGDAVAEVAIARVNDFEWTVTAAGRDRHVVIAPQATGCLLEIDGIAHRVDRDEGTVVRAQWPGLIVSVAVAAGQDVVEGDPLIVSEAMKMESTLRAPFAGTVTSVEVLPNEQVHSGAPLVLIRPASRGGASSNVQPAKGARVSFVGMALSDTSSRPPFERVYAALIGYLLGYELDPAALSALLDEQHSFANRHSAGDTRLLAAEDGFLDLFSDLGLLWRPEREGGAQSDLSVTTAREHLLSYIQWLDPDRAGFPVQMRRRLSKVLAHYGVSDLRRNPDLEQAVVLLFGSQARRPQLARVVTGILERRLRYRDLILPFVDDSARARYDRLIASAHEQLEYVADLARDARFRFIEEPVVEADRARTQARMEAHLDALAEDPNRPERAERIAALVEAPQPMRQLILRRRMAGADKDMQSALLEIRARRWYRTRPIRDLQVVEVDGILLCHADYDFEGRSIHLVLAFTPLQDVRAVGAAIAHHLADVDPTRNPVIDLMTWRAEGQPNGDGLSEVVAGLVCAWDLGRPIWRLDVTVTSTAADVDPENRTQYFTFRTGEDGALAEDRFHRNLHPMLAKRLELWRLGNFELTRLPSLEDVYLFHGVARDNPKDHRLFALAEVRDMTVVPDSRGGAPSYPNLSRMGLQAIIAMRRARATFPERNRPQSNRISLFVRPPWTVPREHWSDLAELMIPLAGGAGLELVVLRTSIPQPDGTLKPTVLNVDGIITRDITVSEEPVRDDFVRPLTRYRQKVLKAQRFGVPYPFEILRMFAPQPGVVGKFLPGRFVEHDLDEAGEVLVPVAREPGLNTSNLVVGLLTTYTAAYPEGMTRVIMLSDPTRGLGNLAEPECRIVNAALALAADRGMPVEWFAVSSGALISMESGTENMDWIALTLRRIIEFTQAGGEINIVVTGVNVGGQPYWNAEATMLMHTRGILIMIPGSSMVLTGKQALDFSGGVSADDNLGIGGYERVMGPNGQAQYWAPSLVDACELLLHHYEHTYVSPGERFPRRIHTTDPFDRDVRSFPHAAVPDCDFTVVGDVFSAEHNPERKQPFDVRSVMRSVTDQDSEPLERWKRWRGGENSVVWDARVGGISVCMLGLESRPVARRGFVPADGPPSWTSGTLFPQSSRKTARAVTAASGNRPLVVLANLSGFDGSPESMRHWQLEYGAEIGRAVTNFKGPIVFVVISRYHGGAFVVFSKALNPQMEVVAVEGSYASVIGGAPAAATVFAREVRGRVNADPRVVAARDLLAESSGTDATERRARLAEITEQVRSEKLGEAASEFDAVHTIDRALAMGSVDRIISAADLRPYVIDALERGMAKEESRDGGSS